MDNRNFTQCLIATIGEAALSKFGDHSKFAREAFASYANPAGAWRAIRNPRVNGKARSLYIEDLLCISETLEIQLSELFFRVEQKIKLGWKEEDKPNVQQSPNENTNLSQYKESKKEKIA